MSTLDFVDVHELADEHARRVIASLDGVDPETLFALSAAFEIAGHPLSPHLSMPIHTLAAEREAGDDASWLCLMQTRVGLRSLAYDSNIVARLERVEVPFWSTLRTALIEIREL